MFARGLKIRLRKVNRFSNHDGDRTKKAQSAVAWPGIARAKNPHRYDRRERFRNNQSDARQSRLQISVLCSLAFWKNQSAVASFQNANQRFERAAIRSFLVDGNHIEFWQEPTEYRYLQKRFTR